MEDVTMGECVSIAKADTLLDALRQEAEASGFEFHELAEYAKRLLGLGFKSDTIIPLLRTVDGARA